MNPKEILDPMLDLFSGADGGVAFARLQHEVLPGLIQLAEANNPVAKQKLELIQQFSKLCKICLK